MAEAASRDRRIADARDRLEERLRELAAAVRPRAEYSVVHGELGLDHVLVDRDGNPVLIDGLDEDRLVLCTLTQRLSLSWSAPAGRGGER
ncbi:phosphotransferase [Streptomyces sp. NPDC002920]